MEKKTRYSCKPSTQKLIVAASLSMALLCGLPAAPALAENTETSGVAAPVASSDIQSGHVTDAVTETTETNSAEAVEAPRSGETHSEATAEVAMVAGWRNENGQFHYYDENGALVKNQWINDDAGWHYVDGTGAAVKGWFTTPNGKTWYFDPETPTYPSLIGPHQIGDTSYYFDTMQGLVKGAWITQQDGSWSWANSDGSLYSGWKRMPNGKWFYFDPEDPYHRMVIGVVQTANATYYVDENTGMTASNWVHLPNGDWAWAQSNGAFASGWYKTPNGKTWYFAPDDPQHPAIIGETEIDGKLYYFDSVAGLIKNGWIHRPSGSWSWANENGLYHSGWKRMPNGKWFYFDPEEPHHRMLIGVIQISSGSYYVDENAGMASNTWIQLPTREWTWAQASGALASGWYTTPNGKTWYFSPAKIGNPALVGEQTIDGKNYYFDENYGLARNEWITRPDGVKRWADPDGVLTGFISPNGIFTADNGSQPTGPVKLSGLTLYVGTDHKVKTGWITENGKDHYYLANGAQATGWTKIKDTWYYFNDNGEKQTGWLHLKYGWYYLDADGKMKTGWIKDSGKDYYLSSNGSMQTGYLTWGGKLYWSAVDGVMKEQPFLYGDMYQYAQGYYSATNWLIQIDTTGNRFAVYRGSQGNWAVWYEWRCTTGAPGMWTPHGQFTVGHKGLYFGDGFRCWYYTTISGEYLIHSILYNSDGYTVRDGRLGYNGSHGCVRLATENAKWVYDNIPYGTKIVIW